MAKSQTKNINQEEKGSKSAGSKSLRYTDIIMYSAGIIGLFLILFFVYSSYAGTSKSDNILKNQFSNLNCDSDYNEIKQILGEPNATLLWYTDTSGRRTSPGSISYNYDDYSLRIDLGQVNEKGAFLLIRAFLYQNNAELKTLDCIK